MNNLTRPIQNSNIRITDALFGHYVSLVGETIIPYQWDALNDLIPDAEKSYCINNFRVAAGEKQGEHRGAVFQDTDVYKWIESVAYCIENGSGEAYIGITDELIELIGRAQEPDGYLNTYFTLQSPEKRWKNLTEAHELYGAGHFIEAAVAYYKATGKEPILNIAIKFADLICQVFGPEDGQIKGYPGHQVIELALVKLFRVTKNNKYLHMANFFIKERGKKPNYLIEEINSRGDVEFFHEFSEYDEEYAQIHTQPIDQKTAEGHAVRALYMYSAMADLAYETSDKQLEDTCKALYENITTKRMYITGGIGSSGKLERFTVDYDLPNDHMYCESCASIGLMMFSQRMAALTKDAHYYDTVERALCNTVLAGIAKEGNRYFYVNPLEVWPANCKKSTSMSHVKPTRQKWFSCSCCPPNISRTLASLGQYIYAEDDTSLYINQFISSDVKTNIKGNDLHISMKSDYMQSGKVEINVVTTSSQAIAVRIRIPSYYKDAGCKLNGEAVFLKIQKGYLVIPISKEGDYCIQLEGKVKPRFVTANRNVRADLGKVAMMKGPYVYCLEEVDNGENLSSIYVEPRGIIQEETPLVELPGKMPILTCLGEQIEQTLEQQDDLYGTPYFRTQDIKLKAVPYSLWSNRTEGEMLVWMKVIL